MYSSHSSEHRQPKTTNTAVELELVLQNHGFNILYIQEIQFRVDIQRNPKIQGYSLIGTDQYLSIRRPYTSYKRGDHIRGRSKFI